MTSLPRCAWCENSEIERVYHDTEWGAPLRDDQGLFEFLLLDAFQAGLSWLTILKKREHFRDAFDNFDAQVIAGYSEDKIQELLQNPGIVRNRLKVRAAVTNARAFLDVQQEFGGFAPYIWGFVDGKPKVNAWRSMTDVPATSPESETMSRDLKRRGFTFVGSTICYAFMQAAGLVNDHVVDCFRYAEVQLLT